MIGRPIVTDTGSMYPHGDGPGLKTSLGALLPSITVVGRTCSTAGAGYPDLLQLLPCTRPLWWLSLVVAGSTSVLAWAWDDSRLRRVKFMFPGIAPARVMCRT